MRRRNGKRGKGMATKKEKTKEQRIKTEKTRLKGIFKDLDENKRKLVTPLIEKAAFMSVELDDLQAKLEKDGWTSEYQNGQNQWGTKKSPEAETYIALSKNYAAVIKQLTELVPAAKRKTSRLAALREEYAILPPYRNYIYEYHAKITSGEIIAGKWIKKIYEIIINGLQKQEYFFNAKAANKAIRFIENFCHHSKGRNDLIKLELWQKAIVSVIFGIQDAEKIRIFREIFIVIGRKNGKSLFASAIIAYMAYLEPEYGQEIYCLAPKLDQAALVYDGFYQMVQAEDELAELAKKRRSDIYIAESNTVIKPIAFNAKKSDGFNPQLVVCDEMAAWSGDAGLKQYEVMKSALGARTQPMILSISTAGYINDSIYDELMKRSTSFLKGNSKERRLLPFLYMIDDVEKWNDIDELKKANPNMGVSVKESFFMDEIAVAEGSLSKKAEFLTKYCNIKQNSSIAWLEYQTVENAGVEKTLEDFRDCYAVGGIDLSQTTDLTAASVVIQKDGTLYAFTQFFMPRGRLEYLQATDVVPYDIFVKKGQKNLSGEHYFPYQDVYECENLTPVIREFEGIIKDGDFKIADNNLLKTHFLNVALKHNMETRKFRPIKIEQRAHIDGFVSVIDAMTVRQKYWEECGELLKYAALKGV